MRSTVKPIQNKNARQSAEGHLNVYFDIRGQLEKNSVEKTARKEDRARTILMLNLKLENNKVEKDIANNEK
jgi:hypothetical protein